MTETPFALPSDSDPAAVEAAIDAALAGAGLRVTMKDTLRQYPGCVHWHAKQGREAGTLELTLWPAKGRAWFSVHRNRDAPWIAEAIPALDGDIRRRLGAG
jgi:hypothetical protein